MSENCLYFVPILHLDERIILGPGFSFSVLLFRNLDPSESHPVCVCFSLSLFSLVSRNWIGVRSSSFFSSHCAAHDHLETHSL